MLNGDSDEARKVAPSLLRWAEQAPSAERSVVLRTLPTTDLDAAVQSLNAVGAEVESTGRGVITAYLGPTALERIIREPWVLAVDEPQRFALVQPSILG
jgi:hypothetical protein